MTTQKLLLAVALLLSTALVSAQPVAQPAAAPAQPQVVLTIMSREVNTFAPGIDAAVALTPEQVKQVGTLYREVFGSAAVILANMVLQDPTASAAQRQAAQATLQQSQLLFQAKAREIFTEPQRTLIDKTQAAFNKVYNAAQAQMIANVKTSFNGELETLLTPEQKAAMMKARAEIEAATKKAQEQKAGGATPAPAPAPPANK